ncbi:5'/3'-nucleotidase SurE [Pseudonocardia halophobica]|uniref:5'/3'-nucleotidase SurE n=1 Tax=Pseudonocardia halophobica TaxID=29401 RepID=UPI003D8B7DE4
MGRNGLLAVGGVLVLGLTGCAGGAGGGPVASPTSPAAAQAVTQQAAPLRILLTNDDGWSAPGVVAVRKALRRAGHTVVEVAPADDQSGTGASLTLKGTLSLTAHGQDVWAVGGRPADAAAVGLRSVMASAPPDLVVSGINSGHNVSESAIHSGTVGAAMTAVEFGVPAIAVSGPSTGGNADPAQFAAAADYTARLVGRLAADRGQGPLLPDEMVLNVNYPKVAAGAVAAEVRSVPTSDTPLIDLSYTAGPKGVLTPTLVQGTSTDPDDDAGAVAAGSVALTDLATDPEPPSPDFGVADRLAGSVQP